MRNKKKLAEFERKLQGKMSEISALQSKIEQLTATKAQVASKEQYSLAQKYKIEIQEIEIRLKQMLNIQEQEIQLLEDSIAEYQQHPTEDTKMQIQWRTNARNIIKKICKM